MSVSEKIYGIGAEFATSSELLHAAEGVRDAGYRRWDVHSPFPVHGMDAAMGLGKSWLSAFVFVSGCIGLMTGLALTTIPSFVLYPIIVHGKPFDWRTIPAFFPIMFELTVLFSAFAAVFGMLFLNRLPRFNHPVFNWERFGKVTDDGFFIVIESRDTLFSESSARSLLQRLGGRNIALIKD
jgi:hypothetical protein